MKNNRFENLVNIIIPLVRIFPPGKIYSEPWETYYIHKKTIRKIAKEEDIRVSMMNSRINRVTVFLRQLFLDIAHFEPIFQELGISLLKPFELLQHIQNLNQENRELRFALENKRIQEHETRNPHILNILINETQLEQRTIDKLQESKIFTLGDLVNKKKADLYRIRNFGFRRVNALEHLLEEHGLSFEK